MNDRLKIRVWDKVYKHYWKEEEVYENIQWLLYPDNDNINNVEVERCTVLKDKNGNLIYFGDIVKVNDYSNGFSIDYSRQAKHNKEVRWSSNGTSVDPFSLMYNKDEVEVIGNIHQNPELLK